jgi:hypothetical protein
MMNPNFSNKNNANGPNFFSSDKKKLDVQKKDIKKKFINRYEYENNWKKVSPQNKHHGDGRL